MYPAPIPPSPALRGGSPRPCLKHRSAAGAPGAPPGPLAVAPGSRVHFPPNPALSTTFPTHSKSTYDRRPLVVAPNVCALPARGCPGRTYTPPSGAARRRDEEDARHFSSELPFPPSSPPSPVSAAGGLPGHHGSSSSESEESRSVHQRVIVDAGIKYVSRPATAVEHDKEREERRRRRREMLERARWKSNEMQTRDDLAGGAFGGF